MDWRIAIELYVEQVPQLTQSKINLRQIVANDDTKERRRLIMLDENSCVGECEALHR